MKTVIIDRKLAAWLRQQGAPQSVMCYFVLEKGSGERIGVTLVNGTTVELE